MTIDTPMCTSHFSFYSEEREVAITIDEEREEAITMEEERQQSIIII